jgi:MFS transporter
VSRPARLALAACAFLALADTGVVALALPPILRELDTDVAGVAAVLGVYALVLGVALLAARPLQRYAGVGEAGVVGVALFSAGSLLCGLADTLGVLLAARAVQAVGGAFLLVTAYTLLSDDGPGSRLWRLAALVGTAAGPALGGALTQAFDWRAIFLVQAPVGAAAAVAARRSARARAPAHAAEPAEPSPRARPAGELFVPAEWSAAGPEAGRPPRAAEPWRLGPAVALALLSAALVGVLFLLVLLLVTGWSVTPLAAAAAVSVLPVTAVAAARVRGPARVRAAAGAALVGGGVLALASLPDASLWWTVPPQVLAGVGMGLALPALAGELLPEDTAEQAARLLTVRHAGITIALVLLAPIAAARVDHAVETGRLRGTALVLDAKLPPLEKISLAGKLVGDLDPVDPRGELKASLGRARAGIDPEDRPAYDTLARRADEAVVAGVQDAFAPVFAICGILALLGAVAVLPRDRRGVLTVAAAGAAALALAGTARLAQPELAPEPVVIADPCKPRELPHTGGVGGALQDVALRTLDRAACRFGSSREELALALVDDDARAQYEREYGVDPRSVGGLLGAVLGL